jgi:hypothetical protein
LTSASSVPVIADELAAIGASVGSGEFQMPVGLKKRNAVLVTVPAPGVVAGADGGVVAGDVVVVGVDGAVEDGDVGAVSGLVGWSAGATGGDVGATGLGAGEAAPEAAGPLGWPALTGAGLLTFTGVDTFVRCAGAVRLRAAWAPARRRARWGLWHFADRWQAWPREALAAGVTTRPAPTTITVSSAVIARRHDFNMLFASECVDVGANPAARASYDCRATRCASGRKRVRARGEERDITRCSAARPEA